MTGADVVACARTWIGTPFVHQHRIKGVGADCLGLIIGVCRELLMVESTFDVTGYTRQPDGTMISQADVHMTRVMAPEIGDIAVFRFDRQPQHMGFIADYVHGGHSVIHALDQRGRKGGKVVEHRLDPSWRSRIVAVYRLPGIA